MTLDYSEMKTWINNDEWLYNLWKESRLPISRFISQNRKQIRSYIRKQVS